MKLNRNFVGFEIDRTYCLLALKRVEGAKADSGIQGYSDSVFWERNTLAEQLRASERTGAGNGDVTLQSTLQTSFSLHEGASSKTHLPLAHQLACESQPRRMGVRRR